MIDFSLPMRAALLLLVRNGGAFERRYGWKLVRENGVIEHEKTATGPTLYALCRHGLLEMVSRQHDGRCAPDTAYVLTYAGRLAVDQSVEATDESDGKSSNKPLNA